MTTSLAGTISDGSTSGHAGATGALGNEQRIAVVIPCYRVRDKILSVLDRIGPEVAQIIAVDDCCPEKSGAYIEAHCSDPRVQVLYHEKNLGVGGATMTAYRRAADLGMSIIVKIDGDGQMDPALLPYFVAPILRGEADYTKGNRFYDPGDAKSMPAFRLIGNSALSFFSKLSSGYWSVFDPTNGYTAIHATIVKVLALDKIDRRYFFESDMLFRLNLLRCRVVDIPMAAVYADERSSLSIRHALIDFTINHARNFVKRVFYAYFLRDFSIASLQLVFGIALILFGVSFGAWSWYLGWITQTAASSGTVMLSGLPIILGFQLLLSFLSFDVMNQPTSVAHLRLAAVIESRRRNAN